MQKPKPTHMLILGTTGSGKTTYCNELQRTFPLLSIFVDTKGNSDVWGARISNLGQLPRLLAAGNNKIVWDPPRRSGMHGEVDWEQAIPQLLHLWAKVQEHAQKKRWSHDKPPWIQLIVDEAQRWEGKYLGADGKEHRHPATLFDMAGVGLGLGLRLVYATQYPANLEPETRDNLNVRVVFRLGEVAERVVESWRWPLERIRKHTATPFAYLTQDPVRGWVEHIPRPRA